MDAIRQYELLVIKLDSWKHQNKCKKTCQYYYNLIDHSTTQSKREMLEVTKSSVRKRKREKYFGLSLVTILAAIEATPWLYLD